MNSSTSCGFSVARTSSLAWVEPVRVDGTGHAKGLGAAGDLLALASPSGNADVDERPPPAGLGSLKVEPSPAPRRVSAHPVGVSLPYGRRLGARGSHLWRTAAPLRAGTQRSADLVPAVVASGSADAAVVSQPTDRTGTLSPVRMNGDHCSSSEPGGWHRRVRPVIVWP